MPLRVVFMGTPEFAVPALVELTGQGHDIVAAYTQPPRPAGRGMAARPSPVQEKAEAFGIPVFSPLGLRQMEEQERFSALEADVAIVVAYGLILPQPILEAPAFGCLNLHASLLPRWRGAAPIQRAVMSGDEETGVMVMRMESGLDTGAVCLAERTAIAPEETAGDLHDRLAVLGADLLARALAALERGSLVCTSQPAEGVTYARKIEKAETRIDWSRPSRQVCDHIRGLSPFPGAWSEFAGERMKVLRCRSVGGRGEPGTILASSPLVVACGDGAIEITGLQRSGRRPGPADEVVRGARLHTGDRFE